MATTKMRHENGNGHSQHQQSGQLQRQQQHSTPFGLFRDMSEIFDDFFSAHPMQKQENAPAVNIAEDKDNFYVEVQAPGFKKEELKLSVDKNVLSIQANHKEESSSEEKNYSRREFRCTTFSRSFNLPESADSEKISAKYEDGVLNVTIGKKEEAKEKPARDIQIG